ncbi:Hemgn, partial [Lemmus lemmus]
SSHPAEVIGTWSLRNREQLRKRKAEAQEKQTSQWLLGEQKKRKCQRTGKGNSRDQKRQRSKKAQAEKQRMQKIPAEKETECAVSPVTEVPPLVACPPEAVPAQHCAEVCQKRAIQNHSQAYNHRAEDLSSSTCQEMTALQHSSKMCQDTAEPQVFSPEMWQETAVPQDHSSKLPQGIAGPEVLSPKMCQETAVLQNHSFKAPQDMTGPEALSPKMCQETAVFQEQTLKMCQDVARPEVLSPKTHQETAVVPWTTPGDAAGPGCSPAALPQSDVPEGCPLDACPKSVTPEKTTCQADQGIAVTEGCFPETRERSVSEDVSIKTRQGEAEHEFTSHEIYKFTEPTVSSPETIQDSRGPEEYSPEACHEMPGPEDLSIKTCEKRDGPKDCLPEQTQEAGGAQGQDPHAYQDSDGAVPIFFMESIIFCFDFTEMKEKAKSDQDPETPSSPQGPQEDCSEDDPDSYVLF